MSNLLRSIHASTANTGRPLTPDEVHELAQFGQPGPIGRLCEALAQVSYGFAIAFGHAPRPNAPAPIIGLPAPEFRMREEDIQAYADRIVEAFKESSRRGRRWSEARGDVVSILRGKP